jgi:predicted dehydrogenase
VNTRPLAVGVIGLGVGTRHLMAYAAHPDCRVAAICDLDPDRAHGAAAAHPGTEVYRDAKTMLDQAELDVVSIASFDADHFGQAHAAVSRGCHVFVEKPLCIGVAQMRALRAVAVARPDVVVASNLVLRSAQAFVEMRRLVAAGALGQVYAFDGEYLYGRLHKITDGWRGHDADYSPFVGGAIHLVDLMIDITGERPERVVATGANVCVRESDFLGDDFVAATFTHGSGMVGRITANFGSVTRHQHVVRVYGTQGTLISDDAGVRLFAERDPGDPPRMLKQSALPADKAALIGPFVDACLGRPSEVRNLDHELSVVAACAAADQSRKDEGWIDVEYA